MARIKILIVEDEAITAESLAQTLKKGGYEVVAIAATGAEAIKANEDYNPDIVLMDIRLKGKIDGIETAKNLKIKNKDVPIIFITDLADKKTAERAANVKPSGYLIKPFNPKQILISIHQAIHNLSNKLVAEPSIEQTPTSKSYFVKDCLFVMRGNGHFEKMNTLEILYIKADGSYSHLYTSDDCLTYSSPLNKILEGISLPNFRRISKSYAINIEKLKAIKGNLAIIGNVELTIGKEFKEEILKTLPLLKR